MLRITTGTDVASGFTDVGGVPYIVTAVTDVSGVTDVVTGILGVTDVRVLHIIAAVTDVASGVTDGA